MLFFNNAYDETKSYTRNTKLFLRSIKNQRFVKVCYGFTIRKENEVISQAAHNFTFFSCLSLFFASFATGK